MPEVKNNYELMIEKLPEAYALLKIITDGRGKAVNCRFVVVNALFEHMVGLARTDITGRMVTDIIPEIIDIIENARNWHKTTNTIAVEENIAAFELYLALPKKWYQVQACRLAGGYLALLFHNITDYKIKGEKARYLSFHDRLTGLFNRYYLETEMQRLDTDRQLPISIIVADVNGLKLINDTYGYSAGDRLIKSAAELIKGSCRQEDIITRWGGDEFVVFLPQTSMEEAGRVSERIRKGCRAVRVDDIPFSMALGFAVKNRPEQVIGEVQKMAEERMHRNKLTEYRTIKGNLIKALHSSLREKCNETEEHFKCKQKVALNIGKKLKLPREELKRLSILTLLHDIGKVRIIEEILTKKDALTPAEWEKIKEHPETGCRIVRATEEFAYVADEILSHHERWDGSGYPRGLQGEEIPLLARITAIAEAYEAMTTGRPYKPSISPAAAITELQKCAGSQFDPEMVKLFRALLINNPNEQEKVIYSQRQS